MSVATCSEKQWTDLGQVVANCRQLEILKVRSMGQNLAWDGFLKSLKYVEQLKVLDISENEFDETSVDLFTSSIGECRSLEKLNLSQCLVTVGLSEKIKTAITECPLLESLNISRNGSALFEIEQVVDLMTKQSIIELDLSYNDLTNADLERIADTLRDSSLTSLSLEGNKFDNIGLDTLLTALASCNFIKTLNVFRIAFTAEGLEAILKKIKNNKSICAFRILLPVGMESLYEVVEDQIELNLKRLHFASKWHRSSTLSTKLKLDEIDRQKRILREQSNVLQGKIESLRYKDNDYKDSLEKWLALQKKPIERWNHNDVLLFLKEIDLDDYAQYFKDNAEFNGPMLLQMNSLYLHRANLMFEQSKRLQEALFLIQNKRTQVQSWPAVLQWTNERVLRWLEEKGFGDVIENFKISPQFLISGKELLFLDNYDLIERLHLDPKKAAMIEVAISDLKKIFLVPKVLKNPDQFMCPITYELMKDPVVASDGHVYERSAIEHWLDEHDRSPLTNEIMLDKKVYPCIFLKNSIKEYLAEKQNEEKYEDKNTTKNEESESEYEDEDY